MERESSGVPVKPKRVRLSPQEREKDRLRWQLSKRLKKELEEKSKKLSDEEINAEVERRLVVALKIIKEKERAKLEKEHAELEKRGAVISTELRFSRLSTCRLLEGDLVGKINEAYELFSETNSPEPPPTAPSSPRPLTD